MKGIIKKKSSGYTAVKKGSSARTACLILGMEKDHYYLINEVNMVVLIEKKKVEVIDFSRPDFWIEENGRLIPEEWRRKYFLSLNNEPEKEWEEIWFITQFARGLEKFRLPVMPVNFEKAGNTAYKVQLISDYLEMAGNYDSLVDRNLRWRYRFGLFRHIYELPYLKARNSEPHYFQKILLTEGANGMEVLRDLLQQIGSPFDFKIFDFDFNWLQTIRNRIMFSIWSVFGTDDFDVYNLIYEEDTSLDYLLKKNSAVYFLSFDYFI